MKKSSETLFNNLKAVGLKTQIWIGFEPTYFKNLSDEEALNQTIKMIAYLAKRAEALGCQIALYNHGGWFGKPTNQIKIIQQLPNYNIGVVYNFHHAHDAIDDYPAN